MKEMFLECSKLTDLDLSNFDTSNVTDTYWMFGRCYNLVKIYTPYNLKESVSLPETGWRLPDGTEVTELPMNLSHSIMITRTPLDADNNNNDTPADDNNNENDNNDENSNNNGGDSVSTDSSDDNNQNNNNGGNSNNTNENNNGENSGLTNGDNNGQNNSGNSGTTDGENNTTDNTWNNENNSDQTGATSGTIEGTGDTTDIATYGRRQLTVTPITFNKIQLTWDAVPSAKSYEIFYSTSPDSGFKRLANAKKTFYKFSKAKCGVTYYFQMRVCQKGVKSEFGPVSYGRTALSGSATLQIKKTTYNSVSLKWNKVPGAKKYEIFYADSMGGGWRSLGVKGGTSFTHKKLVTGATYYYQIRPVRDSFYGSWSNGVSTTTALDNVSKLKVKATGADRMKLSWKKVNGATQYVILRADSSDGTYEVIGHSAKPTYMDTGLQSSTTYFYKVYAVSGPYRTKETSPVGQTTKIAKK